MQSSVLGKEGGAAAKWLAGEGLWVGYDNILP